MARGSVLRRLLRQRRSHPLHMTLLDPDKQRPEVAGRIATAVEAAGTSALMVGGSTGVSRHGLDDTLLAIKSVSTLPVILFPGGAAMLSPYADAVYFMSMLNSTIPRFLVDEQARGAPFIAKLGIEPIPMGYIIVAPGMRVGEVGRAKVVERTDHRRAIGLALTGQYFGMALIYLEAGSGADKPVPPAMISAVKAALDIPLIVGGGIRTPAQAAAAVAAGADIIVTGTIVEQADDVHRRVAALVEATTGRHRSRTQAAPRHPRGRRAR